MATQNKDSPVNEPWTGVIGLETDGKDISSVAHTGNVAPNRVIEIIRAITCTADNEEGMLE